MRSRGADVEPLAALSVDLDEVNCYTAIHGLDTPPDETARAIYRKAVPRFAQLFEREDIPATFFVIGRDAQAPGNGDVLRQLHEQGHELGNHSLNHLYDLTRCDPRTIWTEVAGGAEAIERAAGVRPAGFRAPGYTTTDTLLEVVEQVGHRYDSSVFPCPLYYGAKTAAIGAIALRGRRSQSVVDDPRVLRAPADPYRLGRPYWTRGNGLVELPIGVTRDVTGRLPFIGTSVVLSGRLGAATLTRMICGRPFVNLELHGIDLADAEADGLDFLRPHQPDLRRSAADKEAALLSAVRRLRNAGYRFVTLARAAQSVA